MQWMDDFEAFQAAVENDSSYSSGLSRSLCLVLDEFYRNLRNVGVSAVTGAGMVDFFAKLDESGTEYMQTYWYATKASLLGLSFVPLMQMLLSLSLSLSGSLSSFVRLFPVSRND
jgi:hypothetical protein